MTDRVNVCYFDEAMSKKPYFKFRQGTVTVLNDLIKTPSFSLIFLEMMTYYFPQRGQHDPPSRLFPSIRTLAMQCSTDERTIKRAFACFRKRGVLVQVGWENRNPIWEVPESTKVRLGI